MPRYALVPSTNSLSHLAKALAIGEALAARGHEVCVGVAARNLGVFPTPLRLRPLPDLQEADGSGFPTPAWFTDPERIRCCVEAERAFLREERPDRVLGVFRFTLPFSAALEGVPFDSLICAALLPESPEVLGFAPGEPGREEQRQLLDTFFRFAGSRLSRALAGLGAPPVADARELLRGERTFLWDFPEFAPLPDLPGVHRIGPVPWRRWPVSPLDLAGLEAGDGPLAVLSFGTCVGSAEATRLAVAALRQRGFRVLVAAGGQRGLMEEACAGPGVTICGMAPMDRVLPLASLVVCHGGQMTVFEALAHGLPVLVVPFQPEQAQSGVALERLGCGGRLVPPTPFGLSPGAFPRTLEAVGAEGLGRAITRCLEGPDLAPSLAGARARLAGFDALAALGEAYR